MPLPTRLIASACLSASFIIALTGCGEQDTPRDLLSLVPEDSPYVILATKKLPPTLLEDLLRAAARNWARPTETPPPENEPGRRLQRLNTALKAELKNKMTPAGLRSLGIEPNGRFLAYGLGILPVLRQELADEQQAGALIQRAVRRSGLASEQRQLGDISYRRIPMGEEVTGILAVHDGFLIAGLLPVSAEQSLLPYLFGEKRPLKPLAPGRYAAFLEQHGFHGHADGYLDLIRFIDLLEHKTQGVSAQVMRALDTQDSEDLRLSPGCATYYRKLSSQAPRIALGLSAVSDHHYEGELIWETSLPVARALQALPAPLPDPDPDHRALLSARLGVDLPHLRDALQKLLRAALKDADECESVDTAALNKSLQSTAMLANPLFAGIEGLAIAVKEVKLDPRNGELERIEAEALLATDDPRGLFSLLGLLSPRLARLEIPDDGTPVPLPLQDLAPMAPPLWIAIKDQTLALAIGRQRPDDLSRLLKAQPDTGTPPLFALRYDFEGILREAGPALESALQQARGEQAETLRETYAHLKQSADLYAATGFRLGADQRGAVLRTEVYFNKASKDVPARPVTTR